MPRKPVNAEEIETFLDYIASRMAKAGNRAALYAPIWRALERELAERREILRVLEAAEARSAGRGHR